MEDKAGRTPSQIVNFCSSLIFAVFHRNKECYRGFKLVVNTFNKSAKRVGRGTWLDLLVLRYIPKYLWCKLGLPILSDISTPNISTKDVHCSSLA